jgi:hypothetical protein
MQLITVSTYPVTIICFHIYKKQMLVINIRLHVHSYLLKSKRERKCYCYQKERGRLCVKSLSGLFWAFALVVSPWAWCEWAFSELLQPSLWGSNEVCWARLKLSSRALDLATPFGFVDLMGLGQWTPEHGYYWVSFLSESWVWSVLGSFESY